MEEMPMERVISFDVTMEMTDVGFDATMDADNHEFDSEFENLQIMTAGNDYNALTNKPTINGVTLEGDQTTESLGIDPLPEGGQTGDILMRVGDTGAAWETPASSAEQDNTRPITAAAVYTEIGNINALLATI